MATKLQLAALLLGAALCTSAAFAKPPPGSVNTYTPPATQTDSNTGGQGSNGGVATPDSTTNAPLPTANPDRRFSSQQRARMRACINNCIAAGMTGPFCSHSCIPD